MTSESNPPGGGARPFFDLSGLIDSLHRLYLQISGKLLHRRLGSQDSEAQARDVNIEGKLERRLADVANQAGEEDADGEAADAPGASVAGAASRPAARKPAGKLGKLRSRLARGFRRRSVSQSQLHLGEKMQASTWDHINKAQLLARQGKLESARMHAGLAQNAMETASRHMGEEEYAAFKTDVEARIRSIETG